MNHSWIKNHFESNKNYENYKCTNCNLIKLENTWGTEYYFFNNEIIKIITLNLRYVNYFCKIPTCDELIIKNILT